MALLTNPITLEIVIQRLEEAKQYVSQCEEHEGGALRHVEARCRIAMNLIEKYINLDEPKNVCDFFKHQDRIMARFGYRINHLNPAEQMEGLDMELDKLIGLVKS